MARDGCTVGVDLGGQSVKLALVTHDGHFRLRRNAPVDATLSAGAFGAFLVGEIRLLLERAAERGYAPRAIGVVMPGYMDRERTELDLVANLPQLSGSTLLADLRGALDLPVVFDADCNAAALGEYAFGAGRGVERLMVVTIGTGIGGGVIVDGQVLRVRQHIAGSLGHVVVDARGPRCGCGGRGCVEVLAAGPAIERRAAEAADGNPASALARLRRERGRLTGVEIREALEAGDADAHDVVRACGRWLGVGIASWTAVFDPELVLLGGGIAALGEPWFAAVREGLEEVGQPRVVAKLRIEPAALGGNAGVIGAGVLAKEASSGK